MKVGLSLIIGCWVSALYSQSLQISNLGTEPGGKVSFTAEIDKSHSDRELYQLQIYSNLDGFQTPLDFEFSGMKPGEPYDISFEGNEVFGTYQGDVQLRFDVVATTFPIRVDQIDKNFKPGKKVSLAWTDFHNVNNYNIELYQGINLVQTLASGHRSKQFEGVLSKDVEKGSNYTLLIEPVGEKEYISDPFAVQVVSGVGLAVKIAPLAALGVAVPVFLLGGGGGTPGGNTFEDPPGPPSGN